MTQNWIVGLEYDYADFQTKNCYQLAGAWHLRYKSRATFSGRLFV